MADDAIAQAGLHFDELNKIRVLEPEIATQTNELKDECRDFLDKMAQFQKIVGGFIQLIDGVSMKLRRKN